jgi:hypothetical protein
MTIAGVPVTEDASGEASSTLHTAAAKTAARLTVLSVGANRARAWRP